MGVAQRECLPPARLDELAAGDVGTPAETAHLARCRACAELLETARFARRFAGFLAGEFRVLREAPEQLEVLGYAIRRELAQGAQGVVYEAVQLTTGQRVAIKVGHLSGSRAGESRSARARFLREIRIAGHLSHPGIVRPLDSVCLPDGREALILELVEGDRLDSWAQRIRECEGGRPLVLDILAQIAEAVDHAHKRGVIHRDLKPTNVLIDGGGRARVLDFGVARQTDLSGSLDERITLPGEFTGTLAYAAPEQVAIVEGGPDVRSDVYSLGVMGFEALTGGLPYSVDGSLASVIRNICEVDIPRATRTGLDADSWAIVNKAMAKDPARRYQSAADLAKDLRSAAAGAAILARADSRWYTLRKAAQRQRIPIGIGCLLALGCVATIVTLMIGNARLNEALDESRLLQIRAHLAAGSRDRAEVMLWDEIAADIPIGEDPARMLWRGSPREKKLLWCFVEMQAAATCLRVDPSPVSTQIGVWPIADGGFLTSTSDSHLARLDEEGNWVRGERMGRLPENAGSVRVDPSGRYLICTSKDELWIMLVETGEHLATIPLDAGIHAMVIETWGLAISETTGRLRTLALPGLETTLELDEQLAPQSPWLDPERGVIAFVAADGLLRVFDIETGFDIPPSGAAVLGPTQQRGLRTQILLNPDWTRLVVGFGGGFIVRDLTNGAGSTPIFQSPGNRLALNHAPDWSLVSTFAAGDPTLHLWDPRNWRWLGGFSGHYGSVISHAFSRDGSRIITVDDAGTLRVWLAPSHSLRRTLGPPTAHVHQLAFDDVAGIVAIPGVSASSLGYEAADGSGEARVDAGIGDPTATRVAISDDGMFRAEADLNGAVKLFSAHAAESPSLIRVGGGVVSMQYRRVAAGVELGVCLDTNELLILDPRTSQIVRRVQLSSEAMASDMGWSPDGSTAAVSFRDGTLAIMHEPDEPQILRISQQQLRSVAFLPDGWHVAAVGDDGRLHLVDIRTGRVQSSDRLSEQSLFCVAVHPAGGVAMIGDRAGMLMAVDLADLTERASFEMGGSIMSMDFSSDGNDLAVSGLGRPVEVWGLTRLANTFTGIRPRSHMTSPAHGRKG